jgi:multidrug efflux pump subunit AcrB
VTFLYGVSKFLFSALALAVAISLFASYFVAMTVIPLFCSKYLKSVCTTLVATAEHDAARLQCPVQPRLQPAAGSL